MSTTARIARLEALLARVTARASAPRHTNGKAEAARSEDAVAAPAVATEREELTTKLDAVRQIAALDEPEVLDASAASEPLSPIPMEVEVTEAEVDANDEAAMAAERSPEPPPVGAPAIGEQAPHAALASDAAPDTTIAEPSEAAREAAISDEVQSRERIIAASPAPVVELDIDEAESVRSEPDGRGPDLAAASAGSDAAPDAMEPPASSRRPIALEPKLEELAFGEAPAPAPLHTPPPESGRQVAAPPVDLDFEGDVPPSRPLGVRSRETPPPAPAAAEDVTVPHAIAPRVPEGIMPSFHGAPARFQPKNFGELLDATLEL